MSEDSTCPLLVLVDGHALAYRSYHALNATAFTTSTGASTNAIYGFTRKILEILEEGPAYFAISFDRGLSGREILFEDYKATREKMPDDLNWQIEQIQDLVRAFNIPVLALDGYEADDVIGTVTKQAEALGCDVRIVTGDRDLLQLVSEHTTVQLPKRGEADVTYDLAGFDALYNGLSPGQLTDLKGLMGDSSDNIPGIKGIGQKTGEKLLAAYGNLEGIYEHLGEIKGAQHQRLSEGREVAFLSRQLATIQQDVPITLSLDMCVTHDYSLADVDAIFERLEFRTLRRRLHQLHTGRDDVELPEPVSTPLTEPPVEVTVVDTAEKLAALVSLLEVATVIAFDTETTGLDKMSANLVGISLAIEAEHGYYIPVGHISSEAPDGTTEGAPPPTTPDEPAPADQGNPEQAMLWDAPPPPQLPLASVIEALRPALTAPAIPKIAHNGKFDLIILRRYGIDVSPIQFDTMIGAWLVQPETTPMDQKTGLKQVVKDRLQYEMTDIEALIGKGRKQITMARVPIEASAKYATADAALLIPLREKISQDIAANAATERLFEQIEMPLVPIVADMEMHGVLLDLPYLEVLSDELSARLAEIERSIYVTSGRDGFNINSTRQLAEVLFDHLKLSTQRLRKTKTGHYSLTADVLESLKKEHDVVPLILEYRQVTKLLSTYVDALPKLVNAQTGRVHTSFNQTGAATGRFSSSEPNLQNIPIRTEEGRRVRQAFIAPANHVLLSVDYSQIELRILAHFSGDEALIEAFAQGQDIHATTAAAVHRIPLDTVSFEQRSFAKAVNFGLMYGMSAFRLARDSDLTLPEANDFVEAYFDRFPGVKAYLDQSREQATEQGYVETLLGRRRYFPALQEQRRERTNAVTRQRAEREAINMPIQGTAADILKIAMLNLARRLETEHWKARMIIQVHDELVLEVPEDELDSVAHVVIETMESALELRVPLVADAKYGRNWHHLEPLKRGDIAG